MTVTERFRWGVDRETETATWSRKVAGALFAAVGGWFVTILMLAAALVPGYELGTTSFSELGVAEESALLFNGSLLVIGILTVVGGYLFYRSHDTPWLLGMYCLAGLGAFAMGVFTEDYGVLHLIFVALAFLCYNLSAIGTGVRIRGPMVVVSVLMGAIGLVFAGILVLGITGNPELYGPLGVGGVERMVLYPAMLWLLIFGGYMLASTRGRGRLVEEEVTEESSG